MEKWPYFLLVGEAENFNELPINNKYGCKKVVTLITTFRTNGSKVREASWGVMWGYLPSNPGIWGLTV
jgi:hypothetical protein